MIKVLLAAVVAATAICVTLAQNTVYPDVLRGLTSADIVSQMSQIDVNQLLLPGTYQLNETLVIELLEARRIGSILNSPSSGNSYVPSVDEWRALQKRLYELSTQHGTKIPIVYGLDSVHGANYIFGATLFPQQIGAAATFNTTVAYMSGRITALETRYAGIPWVFSPILGIAVQPSWARVYETFGEDTHLATKMGVAIINGLQSPPPLGMNLPPEAQHLTAACIKHYIGYPNVRTGHDRTPVYLPMNILMQYFAPPFQAAINAGALSAMENYIELNGKPVVASRLILKTLLRDIMKFSGMLVTDYNEIYNLFDFHRAVGSYKDAVAESLNRTTIDMGMIGSLAQPGWYPYLTDTINELIGEGRLTVQRVAQSAYNVLTMKRVLGLRAGSPVPQVTSGECFFGCDSHRDAGLDAARQSIVLLQNKNGFLPLPSTASGLVRKLGVIGQACNNKGLLAGGWTVHWQGTSNNSAFPYGSTVLDELTKAYHPAAVSFSEGCNVTEDSVCGADHLANAIQIASESDYVVVCVGERHYAEKPGDIDDLTLPGQQIGMVNKLAAVNPKIVVVLVEGRPRILQNIPDIVPAIVHAFLPGPSGGQAIAEVLTGAINPSGRLPITYPRTINNAPIQYWRKYSANTGNDYDVQWTFGHGLSYSTVVYSQMTANFSSSDAYFYATVTVSNVQGPAVDEVVLLYSTQSFRAITPEVQQLRAFTKVRLQPGESRQVTLQVFWQDLAYYDEYNCQRLDKAPVTFMISNQSASAMIPVPFQWPCDIWGDIMSENTGSGQQLQPSSSVPTTGGSPPSTPDYFISSIVCFGAGGIGTVFIVVWLRKRNQGYDTAGQMLAPNTV